VIGPAFANGTFRRVGPQTYRWSARRGEWVPVSAFRLPAPPATAYAAPRQESPA
jgi:hypothetical protein